MKLCAIPLACVGITIESADMRRTVLALALIGFLLTQGALSRVLVLCHSGASAAIEILGHASDSGCHHHCEDHPVPCDDDPDCDDQTLSDDALAQRSQHTVDDVLSADLPIPSPLSFPVGADRHAGAHKPRGPPQFSPPLAVHLRSVVLII